MFLKIDWMKSKMYTNEDQIEFERSNWRTLPGKKKARRMEKEKIFFKLRVIIDRCRSTEIQVIRTTKRKIDK